MKRLVLGISLRDEKSENREQTNGEDIHKSIKKK